MRSDSSSIKIRSNTIDYLNLDFTCELLDCFTPVKEKTRSYIYLELIGVKDMDDMSFYKST